MKHKVFLGILALGSMLALAGCSNNSNSSSNTNILSKNSPSAQSIMADARKSLKNQSKSNVISFNTGLELDITDNAKKIKDVSYILNETGKSREEPALLNYVQKVELNDKSDKIRSWITPNKVYTKENTDLVWYVENHKSDADTFQVKNNFSDSTQQEIDNNSKVKEKGKYYVVSYSTDYNHPATNKKIVRYLKSLFKKSSLPNIIKIDSNFKNGYFTENDYKSSVYVNKKTKKIEKIVDQTDIMYDKTKSDDALNHYAAVHITNTRKYLGNDPNFKIPSSIVKNAHKNPFKTK